LVDRRSFVKKPLPQRAQKNRPPVVIQPDRGGVIALPKLDVHSSINTFILNKLAAHCFSIGSRNQEQSAAISKDNNLLHSR